MMAVEEDSRRGGSNTGSRVSLAATVRSKKRGDSEHANRYLCAYLLQNQNGRQLHYHDADCGKDYGSSRFGNYLMRWYLTRYIASQANATLTGSCKVSQGMIPQTNLRPQDLVMDDQTMGGANKPSWQEICSLCLSNVTKVSDMCVFPHGVVGTADDTSTTTINMAYMVPTIRKDMKGLLQGVLQQTPQLEEEMDDVAIHLRLGDVGSISSGRYGLVPFSVYVKYVDELVIPFVDSEPFTIGIVTAPFQQHRGRHRPNNPHFNQAVVEAATDFLRSKYPKATVTIRNSAQDTHNVVFARLLGAKKLLFCAPSTFCLVPALGRASPKHSIMVQSTLFGSSSSNLGWLGTVQESSSDGAFRYVKESLITSTQLQQMSIDKVVETLSS
ncbi:MAG: hypothetical protein SGILL_002462 [Bacillariaceae sp.]